MASRIQSDVKEIRQVAKELLGLDEAGMAHEVPNTVAATYERIERIAKQGKAHVLKGTS